MGSLTAAEDEKEANGMPRFDSQLPVVNSITLEKSTFQPYRTPNFGAFLEDALDLRGSGSVDI